MNEKQQQQNLNTSNTQQNVESQVKFEEDIHNQEYNNEIFNISNSESKINQQKENKIIKNNDQKNENNQQENTQNKLKNEEQISNIKIEENNENAQDKNLKRKAKPLQQNKKQQKEKENRMMVQMEIDKVKQKKVDSIQELRNQVSELLKSTKNESEPDNQVFKFSSKDVIFPQPRRQLTKKQKEKLNQEELLQKQQFDLRQQEQEQSQLELLNSSSKKIKKKNIDLNGLGFTKISVLFIPQHQQRQDKICEIGHREKLDMPDKEYNIQEYKRKFYNCNRNIVKHLFQGFQNFAKQTLYADLDFAMNLIKKIENKVQKEYDEEQKLLKEILLKKQKNPENDSNSPQITVQKLKNQLQNNNNNNNNKQLKQNKKNNNNIFIKKEETEEPQNNIDLGKFNIKIEEQQENETLIQQQVYEQQQENKNILEDDEYIEEEQVELPDLNEENIIDSNYNLNIEINQNDNIIQEKSNIILKQENSDEFQIKKINQKSQKLEINVKQEENTEIQNNTQPIDEKEQNYQKLKQLIQKIDKWHIGIYKWEQLYYFLCDLKSDSIEEKFQKKCYRILMRQFINTEFIAFFMDNVKNKVIKQNKPFYAKFRNIVRTKIKYLQFLYQDYNK